MSKLNASAYTRMKAAERLVRAVVVATFFALLLHLRVGFPSRCGFPEDRGRLGTAIPAGCPRMGQDRPPEY